MDYFCVLLLLNFIIVYSVDAQNAFNFVIRKFYWPGGISEQKVQLYINPVDFNPGLQLVDVNYSSPIPVGKNVMVKLQIDADTLLRKSDSWLPLVTISDDVCRIFEVFLGQLIFEAESALGIIPKSCPIPKGTYHAVNYTVNFKTLKLQTFPYGNIRFRANGVDRNSKENLFRLVVIFENLRD